jgi:hypothetical protein
MLKVTVLLSQDILNTNLTIIAHRSYKVNLAEIDEKREYQVAFNRGIFECEKG